MSFISQSKNNKQITCEDQLAVLSVKEWDIGISKGLLSFRVYKGFFKDYEDPEDEAKIISSAKINKNYSSNINRQGSLEKRSISSQSSDKDNGSAIRQSEGV